MCEHLIFACKGSRSDLRHHEPGIEPCARSEKWRQTFAQSGIDESLEPPFTDARERGQRNAYEIEGESDRLAVKFPTRQHFALAIHHFRVVGEDQRIIDGGIHLRLENAAAM